MAAIRGGVTSARRNSRYPRQPISSPRKTNVETTKPTRMLRPPLTEMAPRPGKRTTPNAAATPKLNGSDQYRSDDSDQQASSPSRMKPDTSQDGASLTAGDGNRHGDCEPEHWRGDAEQRCDAGVR